MGDRLLIAIDTSEKDYIIVLIGKNQDVIINHKKITEIFFKQGYQGELHWRKFPQHIKDNSSLAKNISKHLELFTLRSKVFLCGFNSNFIPTYYKNFNYIKREYYQKTVPTKIGKCLNLTSYDQVIIELHEGDFRSKNIDENIFLKHLIESLPGGCCQDFATHKQTKGIELADLFINLSTKHKVPPNINFMDISYGK